MTEESPEPRPRSPWPPALLVLGALALLHAGVGLVLTRSARADVTAIEQQWDAQALAAASEPGERPAAAGAGFAAWTQAQRVWEDAQRRGARQQQVQALTLGLSASFALQAAFICWMAWRAARPTRAR